MARGRTRASSKCSSGTEKDSLCSARYIRVTKRAPKARHQIMTRLMRQKAQESATSLQTITEESEEADSSQGRQSEKEPDCVSHKETTWGPFDEYDNEMTTLRHPKSRHPLMSPPSPHLQAAAEHSSSGKSRRDNPVATAKRSGCHKYHPYIPENEPAKKAQCFLRPKPTPPVDGMALTTLPVGSVKGSNKLSRATSDTTPSVTATQRPIKKKTVSRLGSATKMATANKRPRVKETPGPGRKVLGERNFAY